MQFQQIYPTPKAVIVSGSGTQITDDEARAGARMVVRLFKAWGLTDAESCVLLGALSPRTYSRWKNGQFGNIEFDRRMRLSILAGIHKGLKYLFRDNERANAWVKKPNADFDGARALDVMLNGRIEDLMAIRNYLDAIRG